MLCALNKLLVGNCDQWRENPVTYVIVFAIFIYWHIFRYLLSQDYFVRKNLQEKMETQQAKYELMEQAQNRACGQIYMLAAESERFQ